MKISEYSRKNTYIYYINKRIILHKKTISRSTNYRNSHVFIYILHILTLIPLSYFLYDLCIDCAHPRYTCLAIDACAFSALMSTGLRKVKYHMRIGLPMIAYTFASGNNLEWFQTNSIGLLSPRRR